MGKKKASERAKGGLGSSAGGGHGLNDREFQAVADAGAELVEEAATAAQLVAGGAKTTNAQLQQRLTLLAELGARGDAVSYTHLTLPTILLV